MIVTGCNKPPPIVSTPPAACTALLPATWREPVESAPIPDTGKTDLDAARAWAQAYVAQSGQLDKANSRTLDAIAIFEKCESLVNQSRPK